MKIAVRGTNWIGDAVMTEPALRMLKQELPEAEVSLVARSWAGALFGDSELVRATVPFDKSGSALGDLRRQVSLLKAGGFDAALLFPNSFESALAARLARIPLRFGYATDGRSLLLSSGVPVPEWKEHRHEAFYYLNLIARFIGSVKGSAPPIPEFPSPSLRVSEERRERARRLLSEAGAGEPGKIVALGVGSTNSRAKRWPAEHYGRLADLVRSELGAVPVLVGGPDETDVADLVTAASASRPISLVGRTDLSESVGVLAEVAMLVTNDMGLAHISAAVGTRTLTLFGPTRDAATRPIGPRSEVIRNPVECAPCMLRDCPIDHRCMRGLSVDAVFERAASMLGV